MKIWTPETYLTALKVRLYILYSCLRLTHLVEVDLFEQFLSQEDQELIVMSSMLEEVQSTHGHSQHEMSDYGSDDEEFDRLLMDAVQQMEHRSSNSPNPEPSLENHDMDTTNG